ncbi:hypothetical protein TKK_0016075 [Trichogramma kaykai]
MSELIEEVQNKSNTTQGFQKTLCSELYKSLKGRMTQYLDMPILKIAMITDPHYFNNFIESEEENDEIKELLFELAGRFAVDSNDNDEECLVFNDEIVKKPKSKLQCRIEEKIAMKQAACNKHDRNIKEEIERFLMESCIRAEDCSYKWCFSHVGKIVIDSRSRLLTSNVEMVAFLHENWRI